jgi:hypothetical protein
MDIGVADMEAGDGIVEFGETSPEMIWMRTMPSTRLVAWAI